MRKKAGNAQQGCITTATYQSADLINLSTNNIKSGVTIAGVLGNVTVESHSDCITDGAIGCVVVGPAFKAADMANVITSNIKSGVTIAGVPGNVVVEAHSDCTGNAQQGCTTTATYQSADLTGLIASNVKSGVTIAGITGAYPSATYPLAGDTGVADLPSLSASIAAGTYEWFKADGTLVSGSIADAGTIMPAAANQNFNISVYRQFVVNGDADLMAANIKDTIQVFGVTGSLSGAPANCAADGIEGCVTTAAYKSAEMANVVNSNIKSGVTIAGVAGNVTPESHSNCTGNGQVGCVTTSTYKSGDLTNVDPANIKTGITIGGVVGAYPSASNPLPGATGIDDLDSATFNLKIKSGSQFEWFDPAGNRYVATGEPNIKAGLILTAHRFSAPLVLMRHHRPARWQRLTSLPTMVPVTTPPLGGP